jgi:nucleoside 2-deoxyribosyltransferase
MKVYIVCSVRGASDEYRKRLEGYAAELEAAGNEVHLPHRDVDQSGRGIDICRKHLKAMRGCDVVHLFYSAGSQGTHFDLGMAFALGKPVIVIESPPYGEGKSYPRMAAEWQAEGPEPNAG